MNYIQFSKNCTDAQSPFRPNWGPFAGRRTEPLSGRTEEGVQSDSKHFAYVQAGIWNIAVCVRKGERERER